MIVRFVDIGGIVDHHRLRRVWRYQRGNQNPYIEKELSHVCLITQVYIAMRLYFVLYPTRNTNSYQKNDWLCFKLITLWCFHNDNVISIKLFDFWQANDKTKAVKKQFYKKEKPRSGDQFRYLVQMKTLSSTWSKPLRSKI
jgi:hypothetical protein